jgi:hypothetical protein
VDRGGYGDLDWQLDQVSRAGRSVLLTAGMKAIGWPEFFIPARYTPPARSWGEVGSSSPALSSAVLDFLTATVERYRNHPALLAWQLENEPLNRSGPRHWWIGSELLERELAVVRRLDPERPLLLTAFGHVNWVLDLLSNPWGQGPSRLLELLPAGGTLGLDVYIRVEQRLGPLQWIWRADRAWRSEAARWRREAERGGRQAWVTEAQAEPWGPRSFQPADIRTVVEGVRSAGYETVLLWGAEHWLSRAALGDRSWLDAVAALPRTP